MKVTAVRISVFCVLIIGLLACEEYGGGDGLPPDPGCTFSGTYKVVVKALKLKDSSTEQFEVEVKRMETVERNAQFSE